MLFTIWQDAMASELGLFPLGSGDDRLSSLPMIGAWKMRDPSLTSTGLWPAGLLELQAPDVSAAYFEEILTAARFPVTSHNLSALMCTIHRMFLIKAHQFLGAVDERMAEGFVDAHLWHEDADAMATLRILTDLAAAAPGVLPYIQDLPMRCRAILFEGVGTNDGSLLGGSPEIPLALR